MSQLQKEVIGRVPSGNMFKENEEQLLKSSGLVRFDKTPYRVIELTTFDGEKHKTMTIVATKGTYLICEFFGQLGGGASLYTIGVAGVDIKTDVDMETVQKFYAEKWFSRGNQVLDFLQKSLFVDVHLVLVDDGLEQKIDKLWNLQSSSLPGKEDKAAIRDSITCLDYGTYRITSRENANNELSAPCQWLQRAVVLYKKHYAEVAQIISSGEAPFGAHLAKGAHVATMVSIDVGAYIGALTVVNSFVLINTGVQIGKNCRIGTGTSIGSADIAPGELPTVVEDNSIIEENVVIGTGIMLPKYVHIGAGVCLKDGNTVVFDRVRGNTIACRDLAPGSVVVMGAINPHSKLVCPCVISYAGLPEILLR